MKNKAENFSVYQTIWNTCFKWEMQIKLKIEFKSVRYLITTFKKIKTTTKKKHSTERRVRTDQMPSNSSAEKDLQTCSADLNKRLSAQEVFFVCLFSNYLSWTFKRRYFFTNISAFSLKCYHDTKDSVNQGESMPYIFVRLWPNMHVRVSIKKNSMFKGILKSHFNFSAGEQKRLIWRGKLLATLRNQSPWSLTT